MKTTKSISSHKPLFLMLSLLLFAFISSSTQAQSIEVKGIVKGKTEIETEVLNGANIFLNGTSVGTTSNKKGEFTFPKRLQTGDILVFSYLGFVKKKVTINKNSTYLTIVLNEDDNQMLGALNTGKIYKSKQKKQ